MANKTVKDLVKFSTKNISSIKDNKKRILKYFMLLKKLEECIINDPDISHKLIYVSIDDDKSYVMNFSSLYMNCTFWLFNITFNEPITEDDVYDLTESTRDVYFDIMNSIISKFLKLGYDLDEFNIIGTVKEKIIRILRFYGDIVSNTFSLYDIMALESRSPEFAEIFNRKIDPNMTYNQVEIYLEKAREKLYRIINEDKQSCLYPFISTNMVSPLQVGQVFVGVGTRQDIDKSILPVVIKSGWIHGLSDVSEFYVESIANRNALILKKVSVPESGYLSRRVNIACLNTHTDSRIYDCGTKHYLDFLIEDYKYLKLIEGKYMLIDPNGPILKEISLKDTDLIGTTVKIRSHTKCITGHQVNKVCAICLGNKHITLKDTRIGGLVSIKLINRITQLGMSAKHASTTTSEDIKSNILNKYFTLDSLSNIYANKDTHAKLLIRFDSITDILSSESYYYKRENSDEYEEEGLDFSKTIDSIYIADKNELKIVDVEDNNFIIDMSNNIINHISKQSGDMVKLADVFDDLNTIDVEVESNKEKENWIDDIKDIEFIEVDLDMINTNEPIFTTKIITEEVSKYLKGTISIIDGSKTSLYKNPESMIYDLIDILLKAKIGGDGIFIHIETLVMNLIRSANSTIQKADYSSVREPKIQFVKLTNSIQNSDLFSGIAFQDLRRQLEKYTTLEKSSPGIFDIFFKNSNFIENGKEFRKTRRYLFSK